MKSIIAALSLLLLTPFSAWSEDIVATWQHQQDVTMELATRDANHIRLNIGPDNYVLVAGEKVYMVTKSGQEWTVMDMDQLAGLASGLTTPAAPAAEEKDRYRSSVTETGRTETIAGYKGTVYVIETKDKSGKVIDSTEAVFSKHADVRQVNAAWQAIAVRMATIVGKDTSQAVDQATREAEKSGYGGVLRIGEMQLKEIRKPTLEAAYFELPEGARMMDMGSFQPGKDQGADATKDSDFAKEVGQEAGETAKQEVKQNTVDAVKKGVGNVFKKLF
jgi:hypothetical protein